MPTHNLTTIQQTLWNFSLHNVYNTFLIHPEKINTIISSSFSDNKSDRSFKFIPHPGPRLRMYNYATPLIICLHGVVVMQDDNFYTSSFLGLSAAGLALKVFQFSTTCHLVRILSAGATILTRTSSTAGRYHSKSQCGW